MPEQRSFTIQSLLAALVINAGLLGIIYYYFVLDNALPLNLDPALLYWIVGGVLTLLLWLAVWLIGRGALSSIASRLAAPSAPAQSATVAPARPEPKPQPKATPKPAEFARAPEASAIQMLAILQRKGRLIDFLREDLSAFDDAQIGAAVRSIHDNTRAALDEYVELEPVYNQSEGSRITVQPGFDAYAVRLSGAVKGEPPFSGALQHRGWRITKISLPEQTKEQAESRIVAPAEVEVG